MPEYTIVDPPKEAGLIAVLDECLVRRAPFHIPEPARELLVRFAPWIALVLIVLLLPVVLLAFGIATMLSPFAGAGYTGSFGLTAVFVSIQIVLLAAAVPGLFARRMTGWLLLFYEQLVSIVAGLLRGSIVLAAVNAVVGLYLLFQVRAKYH